MMPVLRPECLIRQMFVRGRLIRSYLYHETNFVLRPYAGPSVITIHDFSFHHYPELHPPERVRHMSEGLPASVEKALHVITDSEFVRREAIERLDIPPEKVTAIALGVDPVFRPRSKAELAPVLERYDLLDRSFVLVVGNFEPRKNLERLVAAYGQLPADVKAGVILVHTGPEGWRNSALRARIERLQSQGRFVRLGYVPACDLPFLIAAARVLAFPSIYEGFGLPPLEAMACGVPVLASDAASIPEVVGSAAALVDARDVDAMADALERLLTNETLRQRLHQQGIERASGFTWKRTAEQTIRVYRRVLTAT